MPTLQINQQAGSAPGKHRIAVNADLPGLQALSFSREIEFELSPQERERIRWYLEDYLQFDEDPAPKIAARVETLMAERGEALFRAIFEGQNEASQLWTFAQLHLAATRIEITTGIAEATSIPWEVIRNPHTRVNLALSAQAFVRAQPGAQAALAPRSATGKVRILLVICRPRGKADVPFRSVASRLVKGLSDAAREAFQLDVLRPPTYEQLVKELKLANKKGEPYHIVHFDGHGTYADHKSLQSAGPIVSDLTLKGATTGPCGYLDFEDPNGQTGKKFVDGFVIGKLLSDAGVPILILNACQSAFSEARAKPNEDAPETVLGEIEAYGSFAQAVVNAGTAGVVAMRYAVYVVTAAQFVAELYGALARGWTLGEAVAFARGNLANQPSRKIAYDARPLQDWVVPVVWERTLLRLWAPKPKDTPLTIKLESGGPERGSLDPQLPKPPDVGFFGRDETLYALDRAFDMHKIVLLHAYAGSGKTATAAEFARWYTLTGGVEGPVLFTSFERHLPLARALDKIGERFGPDLERSGVLWGAANDTQRRQIALELLGKQPVLWIWDNVEPIGGFPAGTPSDWNAKEQQELRDFLLDARDTKAKFLLTSRRDEQAWLNLIPRCIQPPPMPMQERLQFASAIVARRGKRLDDLPDLGALLKFTLGNPLTILVTIGEVMHAQIDSKDKLDAFVTALRGGEVNYQDEETEGRTKSLGASLSYGFANAFNEDERKKLALLHLFQGFVDIDDLRLMGNPKAEWALDEVRGLTREQGIELLDRAAEIGLLILHGDGYYGVHPAVPWYFRDQFARHFAGEKAERARRAFVEAMGEWASYYASQYDSGNRKVLQALKAGEDNLLAAWCLARQHGWWARVISVMTGLGTLFTESGRGFAWRRLVEAVLPDLVDPQTDLPLPGREDEWGDITEYRVRLARQDRNFVEAARLQRLSIDRDRESARVALETEPDQRTDLHLQTIRFLMSSLHELGQIQREDNDPACADSYREAFNMAEALGHEAAQAVFAYNLGNAYIDVTAMRDLDSARSWLETSLGLRAPGDDLGRGKSKTSLGTLSLVRFEDAAAKKRSGEEVAALLDDAADHYQQALHLIPATAIVYRASVHNQLGRVFAIGKNIDIAKKHFQEAIRYIERAGDIFAAGTMRSNFARILAEVGDLPDARAYAEAALTNYREFGPRAAKEVQELEQLVAAIDKAAAEQ
jgi:tetratricopeptide (TPR) repeat protein